MERIGTSEDPGLDPDPTKVWIRFGKRYSIEKYERRWAVYDQEPGFVRPFGFARVTRELYQHNDNWVWVWQEIQTPEEKAEAADAALAQESESIAANPAKMAQIEYLKMMRPEFQPLLPPLSNKKIDFAESSTGLPTTGSWRNSLAVADMNGDGNPDLIAPPQRGPAMTPAIFLGDGKGNWKLWADVSWPYAFQYGGVAAADFNKDGHMDLAFAVHLTGVRVFLGDGRGSFVDSSMGLVDEQYPTRRVAIADVDADGFPDILAISEGPVVRQLKRTQYGKVRAYLNRSGGKKWDTRDAAAPRNAFGGDWLAVGKFNADRYPDFIGSSMYFHGSEIIHLSSDKAIWKAVDTTKGDVVPFMSYYVAVGAGRFSSRNLDDAILSYVRYWPTDVARDMVPPPPLSQMVGIDRITFTGSVPRRVPIARWGGSRGVTGLDEGDFDADGNLDFLISAGEPREFMLFLGDGKGGFTRASIEGMNALANANYDLTVADVNRDKRPDVIIMYESGAGGAEAAHQGRALAVNDGSIRVFLNRGVVSGSATAAKKAD